MLGQVGLDYAGVALPKRTMQGYPEGTGVNLSANFSRIVDRFRGDRADACSTHALNIPS